MFTERDGVVEGLSVIAGAVGDGEDGLVPVGGAVGSCFFEGLDLGVGGIEDGEEAVAVGVERVERAAEGEEKAGVVGVSGVVRGRGVQVVPGGR